MPNEKLQQQVEEYEQELKEGKQKSKKALAKYIFNISIVLIATSLAVFFSVKDNASEIATNLRTCFAPGHWPWLLFVVGMVLLCVLIRSFILFCFARLYSRTYKFHQAIAVDQIGVFYNAVTPGASGGQIMQAYTYKKQGVQVSSAVSILAMYSIVFQTILILFGIVSFIVKYDFLTSIGNINTGITINEVPITIPIWPLTIIGFFLNVGVIAIVLLMGYWHSFHNFIMGPVINFLAKIKLVKNPDKSRENLRIQVENFKIEFRRLFTNIRFTILVSISFCIYMAVKFSIPYFVGITLGNESDVASFWDCIFLSNYHQMVTGLIPIPGSAGVSEYFFYQLFCNSKVPELGFFYIGSGTNSIEDSQALCRAALLIWRFVTFAFPTLIAGLVAAFYRSAPKNEAHASGNLPNRQTFVSLQKETYVQRKEEVEEAVHTRNLSRAAVIEKLKSTSKKKKPNRNANDDSDIDEYDKFDIR